MKPRPPIAETDRPVPARLPRHRHDLPRETVLASQRTRLLIGTAQTVAEKGYAATTIRAIAARAGISTRAFYELYRDKEEAVLATFAAVDTVTARIEQAVDAEHEPRDMFHAFFATYIDTLQREPAFAHTLLIDALGATDRIRERRTAGFLTFAGIIITSLDRARANDPRIPAPDEQLVLAALGGINELIIQQLLHPDDRPLQDIVPLAQTILERICELP